MITYTFGNLVGFAAASHFLVFPVAGGKCLEVGIFQTIRVPTLAVCFVDCWEALTSCLSNLGNSVENSEYTPLKASFGSPWSAYCRALFHISSSITAVFA